MATRSSVLTREIPWGEEPGGLLVSAVTPQKHHQRLHTAGVEWSRDFSKMTQLLITILFCLVTKL